MATPPTRANCPSCGRAISFWNFAKAPTPLHFKCDHCSTGLKLAAHFNAIFAIAVLLGSVIAVLPGMIANGYLLIVAIPFAIIGFELVLFSIIIFRESPFVSREKTAENAAVPLEVRG